MSTWQPPVGNPPAPPTPRELKQLDAKNRFVRTLVQGLGYDVGAAVLIVLVTAFTDADGWGALQWSLISFTVVKSFLVSCLSYVMRMRSGILPPPNPQPEPNEDFPTARRVPRPPQ